MSVVEAYGTYGLHQGVPSGIGYCYQNDVEDMSVAEEAYENIERCSVANGVLQGDGWNEARKHIGGFDRTTMGSQCKLKVQCGKKKEREKGEEEKDRK